MIFLRYNSNISFLRVTIDNYNHEVLGNSVMAKGVSLNPVYEKIGNILPHCRAKQDPFHRAKLGGKFLAFEGIFPMNSGNFL